MGFPVKIPEEEKDYLGVPDDVWERTKDISIMCVFHWLDCLYQDYLDKKVTVETPCSSCPETKSCKACTLETFNLASHLFGLELKSIKPKKRAGKYYLAERKRENGLSISVAGKGHAKIRKSALGTGQPIPKRQERTEVIVVTTEDDELLLMGGNETVQIDAYSTESIGRGMTKINISITGKTVITEMSAISKG